MIFRECLARILGCCWGDGSLPSDIDQWVKITKKSRVSCLFFFALLAQTHCIYRDRVQGESLRKINFRGVRFV